MIDASEVVATARAGWLTLAFMMLLSRVVFQRRGPEGMRAFLDSWQAAWVRRAWGGGTLFFAALLATGLVVSDGRFSTMDALLTGGLLVVLLADGLVNVLPAGFRTFKDRVQEAWVARHAGTEKEGDRHLFGVVNALLAAASAGMAAVVILYKPIATGTVVFPAVMAVILTAALIRATQAATSSSSSPADAARASS